jgi:hypothetical protein
MVIRTNTINRQDIVDAVAAVPGVTFQDTFAQDGWFVPVREFRPRREGFAYGYEIFLSGSSPHRAQHDRNEYAATWIEWGVVIAALYDVDEDAQIGWYESRDDFLEKTSNDYRIRLGEIRRADVPWLEVEHEVERVRAQVAPGR